MSKNMLLCGENVDVHHHHHHHHDVPEVLGVFPVP